MHYARWDGEIKNNETIPERTLKRLVYSIAVTCCFVWANNAPLYAGDDCSKPVKLDDPFADLDDLLTEEEKREALHRDLDRKLALHKSACDPNHKLKKQIPPQTNTPPSAGHQQSGQASGQNGSQSNSQSHGVQTGQQSSDTSQQNQPANTATGQSGDGGRYSSPWAEQELSVTEAGKVSLEPMAQPPANAPESMPQLSPGVQGDSSQPASSLSGTEEQSKLPESQSNRIASGGNGDGQPQSQFLKIYGGQSEPAHESIEDIANGHKSRGQNLYGFPGNTGTNQQNPNYSDPGRKTNQTTTVGADDAVVLALKKRLENESDPEKRKEIQAEIDRYKKK